MGIKNYKPATPASRYRSVNDFADVTADQPHKALTSGKKSTGGRNSKGRLSVWHKGGGHKRRYRQIDFKRQKDGVEGIIKTIEYDPNRSAFIALVSYLDGEYRYILAPQKLKVGDRVQSGDESPIKVGNTLPMARMPIGTQVHNIELRPGRGGQIVRSAGTSAVITSRVGDYISLKLPSSEVRRVHSSCRATIGVVSNRDHNRVSIGKAGRSRWLGKRPTVRGVVMNPVDHPHGGGEGRTSGGRHPVSRTGVPTKGFKTRKKRKYSDKFIVARRKK